MTDNNKRNVVWTLEEDEVLIDFVKNHEPLYNIKCKDYRKTQLKLKLWKEIANIMENKTDTDCNKRWAYVRDYYVRRKEKPGTGAAGEATKKRAVQLSFLDSYCSIKRSNITNIDNSEQEVDVIIVEDDLNDNFENSTQEKFHFLRETPLLEGNNVKIDRGNSKPQKKLKHAGNSEEQLKLLTRIADKQCNEQDETDLFFASIAKIVKKLPAREQVYLRLQIGTMIGNAQLKYLQQQDSSGLSRPSSACSSASGNCNPYQNEASSSTSSSTVHVEVSKYSTTEPLLSAQIIQKKY